MYRLMLWDEPKRRWVCVESHSSRRDAYRAKALFERSGYYRAAVWR